MKKLLAIALLFSGCGDELTNTEYVPVPGPQGTVGDRGEAGADGSPCGVTAVSPSVEAPNGGALITCGDSSVLLLNGVPGPQGEQGPASPYTITEIIDPCGNASGIYDEVLLKLQSGKILASFSDSANGKNTRLSEITQGNYVATDGSNCHFSVDSLGNVSW